MREFSLEKKASSYESKKIVIGDNTIKVVVHEVSGNKKKMKLKVTVDVVTH